MILYFLSCVFFSSPPPAVGRGCIHLDFGQQQPNLPMPPPPLLGFGVLGALCAAVIPERQRVPYPSLSFLFLYTHKFIFINIYQEYIYIYIRRRRREQKRAMEPSPWQSQRYRPLSISFSRYFFPPFSSFDFSFSYPHSCTPPHRARRKKPRHTHNNSLSEKPKASL